MKDLLKKIAISGSGLALLAGTSFASVGNNGTGENSLNDVNFDSENSIEVDVDNDADIHNYLDIFANTGENSIGDEKDHNGHGCGISRNSNNHDGCGNCEDECDGDEVVSGDRMISTGDADASASVTNRVNWNTVDVAMPGGDMGDIGNMDTGRNSENTVCVDVENEVEIDVDNDADIHNNIDVTANTGENHISSSGRGDATITTGDASASATVVNEVNTTSVTVQ